jgi:hypothetical protein
MGYAVVLEEIAASIKAGPGGPPRGAAYVKRSSGWLTSVATLLNGQPDDLGKHGLGDTHSSGWLTTTDASGQLVESWMTKPLSISLTSATPPRSFSRSAAAATRSRPSAGTLAGGRLLKSPTKLSRSLPFQRSYSDEVGWRLPRPLGANVMSMRFPSRSSS